MTGKVGSVGTRRIGALRGSRVLRISVKCLVFGSEVNEVSVGWVTYRSTGKLAFKGMEHDHDNAHQIFCPHLDIMKAKGDVLSIACILFFYPAPLVFTRMLTTGELVFDYLERFHCR
jgi:hypothetical protein